jgi:hypothetical protein
MEIISFTEESVRLTGIGLIVGFVFLWLSIKMDQRWLKKRGMRDFENCKGSGVLFQRQKKG